MIKLKGPEGCKECSPSGHEPIKIGADGLFDVPDSTAAHLIESHGFTLPPPPPPEDETSNPPDDVASMNRQQLFGFLKGLGVSVAPPITNDRLRAIALEEQAKRQLQLQAPAPEDETSKAKDPAAQQPAPAAAPQS